MPSASRNATRPWPSSPTNRTASNGNSPPLCPSSNTSRNWPTKAPPTSPRCSPSTPPSSISSVTNIGTTNKIDGQRYVAFVLLPGQDAQLIDLDDAKPIDEAASAWREHIDKNQAQPRAGQTARTRLGQDRTAPDRTDQDRLPLPRRRPRPYPLRRSARQEQGNHSPRRLHAWPSSPADRGCSVNSSIRPPPATAPTAVLAVGDVALRPVRQSQGPTIRRCPPPAVN